MPPHYADHWNQHADSITLVSIKLVANRETFALNIDY